MRILFILFMIMCYYPKILAQSENSQIIVDSIISKAYQKKMMRPDEMRILLSLYSSYDTNNVELEQLKNEVLFNVLSSDNADCFFYVLNDSPACIRRVLYHLENPIHDEIDIDSCINRIKCLEGKYGFEDIILKSLMKAQDKLEAVTTTSVPADL